MKDVMQQVKNLKIVVELYKKIIKEISNIVATDTTVANALLELRS